MPPLYEQRARLLDKNTKMILVWLSVLDEDGKYHLVKSMIGNNSLPNLKIMHAHIIKEIAALNMPCDEELPFDEPPHD